jgi:adenylate cyclase
MKPINNHPMITKNHLIQLATLTLLWVSVGLLTALYEYLFLTNYPGVLDTAPMQDFDFRKNALAAGGGLFFGSLLFGFLELFYFQRKTVREKFWVAIGKKVVIYALLLFVLLFGISLTFNSVLSGRPLTDPRAWQETGAFVTSIAFWHPVLPVLGLALLSSFLIQLAERFGPNEMWKMFTGKYFNPKEEERIFMFLDLNHSTTIAEKLGNEKFYGFLNDFYHDIAGAITRHKGEVVEYVGDLVVITWPYTIGRSQSRCLQCFQDFEQVIHQKRGAYLRRYGIIPEFKAAVHCGEVIIGEMGKIKKTIKFSGDVLNTTARVEKVCSKIGAKMVITDNLKHLLTDTPYALEKVSDVSLRGKKAPIDVYRVGV